MTTISGRSQIGFRDGSGSGEQFYATDPTTGETLSPGFVSATAEEVDEAMRLASGAFVALSCSSGRERAVFLRTIAAKIESIADEIIERAHKETALPQLRLQGETARTCAQLRLFADVAEEGSWVSARIDRADLERKPTPRPDIRSMLRPIGPVVVFGASNFPLAFSVAGGDTVSAFASGNSVIVKAHPAHPGTSELVGQMIRESVQQCRFPEGTFSLLFDSGVQIGAALVRHPLLKGGGFTGSQAAGRVLMDMAAMRPEPIPFYAEMSSTNPVFILPGALQERAETIAASLYASFTLGAGQFCTKPGLVFLPRGDETAPFIDKLRRSISTAVPFRLLTKGISSSYDSALTERKKHTAVTLLAESPKTSDLAGFAVDSALFEADAKTFLSSDLEHEIFGPTTLLVHHSSRDQLLEIARSLHGHLTATIHGTDSDIKNYSDLIAILENKVGRIVFNGFPTGVEVSHAMVHGGPYPATSDGRSTSVGTRAIFRFTRPVCYQDCPEGALPQELKDANPLGIWRMIDGRMVR
jgi:2,5-dioxopentanoate dehydrogenase